MSKRKEDTRQPDHTHCVACGKRRVRPAKGHASAIDAWLADEFCTTECCKAAHQTNPLVNEARDADREIAEAFA